MRNCARIPAACARWFAAAKQDWYRAMWMRLWRTGKKQPASMWNRRKEYWVFGNVDLAIRRWSNFRIPRARKSKHSERNCKHGVRLRHIWRLRLSLDKVGTCLKQQGSRGLPPPELGRKLGIAVKRKLSWRFN